MSHEGGPESTQQRTVAELLAMYGGDQGERAPRRRRRRDDPTETAPQTIIERVNSESAKFAPIREDQPPPSRTSHRQRSTGHHQPVGEPRPAEPRPAEPRPAEPRPAEFRQAPPRQPEPRQAAPRQAPPRAAAPPVRPAPKPTAPPPNRPGPPPHQSQQLPAPPREAPPPPTQQIPAITHVEPTRPVPPRRPRPAPPQLPSGTFPPVEPKPQQGSGYFAPVEANPQGSGYFPAAPPPKAPPAAPRNGVEPEFATEQLPKIPPANRPGTGSHQVPFPPTRTGFGPTPGPPPPGPERRNGVEPERYPDGFGDLDEDDGPLEDYPGYSDADDADDAEHDFAEDDYAEDDYADEDLAGPSPGREWLIMAGQVAVSVIGGAAVWLGFNWLWGRFPQAALVAALAVIVGLVWMVRKIRRADDLQTTGLAVLVGLFVTVSPAALLLLSR
ncbi:MAG: hypothetical protein ACJ72N_02955 [Labedaea sp.]